MEGLGVILLRGSYVRPQQDSEEHDPHACSKRHGAKTFHGDWTVGRVEVVYEPNSEQVEKTNGSGSVDAELDVSPSKGSDGDVREPHDRVESKQRQVDDIPRAGAEEGANPNNQRDNTEQHCRKRHYTRNCPVMQVQQGGLQ